MEPLTAAHRCLMISTSVKKRGAERHRRQPRHANLGKVDPQRSWDTRPANAAGKVGGRHAASFRRLTH
jgi:hypothetical protein